MKMPLFFISTTTSLFHSFFERGMMLAEEGINKAMQIGSTSFNASGCKDLIFWAKPELMSSFKPMEKRKKLDTWCFNRGQLKMPTKRRLWLWWGRYGHRIYGRQELNRQSKEVIFETEEESTPYGEGVLKQKPPSAHHGSKNLAHAGELMSGF